MGTREAPGAHFRPLVVPTKTDAIDISDSGSRSLRKQLNAPPDSQLPELLEIAVREKVLIMPGTTEPSHRDLSADQIDKIVETFLSMDASLDSSNDNKGDSDTSNNNGPNLPMHHDTFSASVPSAKPRMPMELGPSEEQESLDLTLLEESDDSDSEEDETWWSDEEMCLSDEEMCLSDEEMWLSDEDRWGHRVILGVAQRSEPVLEIRSHFKDSLRHWRV
ncbi:hypothetical protein BGZ97_007479 [Linnemannia gamsii]|uniref:Uncharacterized protein n=1 Tax=Linnemannia gamsii TaxID=64522 RepID=A0A9P6URF0_9FUNG|nr:hypothetical protein BGZ97_007479 [Linnemannia gamsii]